MRIFSWFYLFAFSLDAAVSVIASFFSGVESLINAVQIENLNGKILLERYNISKDVPISIKHLSPGFYLLRIKLSNEEKTFKLIIE